MKTVGIRDNICIKGEKTTCGSKMLEKFIAPYNATIVEKLTSNSIDFKKVSMSEFGLKNDDIQINECAIITDLEGDISKICIKNNLVGIKPTFGLVSRYGFISSAPSLEQVGVIGKTVEDCKELLNIIKGYDKRDSGSANIDVDLEKKTDNLKVGIVKDVKNREKTEKFNLIEVEISNLKYAKVIHYIISSAEASSSLAKYDGIRYGYRTKQYSNLKDVYKNTRKEGFEYETKKKMIAGTFFLDVNNREDYYIKAEKARTMIKTEMNKIFEEIDILIVPVKDNYIHLANLTGRPSLTIGMNTIIGKHFEESKLISLANEIQNGGAKNV